LRIALNLATKRLRVTDKISYDKTLLRVYTIKGSRVSAKSLVYLRNT